MQIFKIVRDGNECVDTGQWNPEISGFVIIALDEDEARLIASEETQEVSGGEDWSEWINPGCSTCTLVGQALPGSQSCVLLTDKYDGE